MTIEVDDLAIEVRDGDGGFVLGAEQIDALFVVERQPRHGGFLTWFGVFARRRGSPIDCSCSRRPTAGSRASSSGRSRTGSGSPTSRCAASCGFDWSADRGYDQRVSAEMREAASVILLRRAHRGFEVFLLRRQSGASFMAIAFVFPGGAAEEGEDARTAAARELFEEAGVLLAKRCRREPRRSS